MSALRAFACAGKRLSFQHAAEELALSPSAVSHQIRGLEERFGVRLFVRGRKSVELTADGERYLESVLAALTMLDGAGRCLARQAGRSRSELKVSALPFFTSTVLIPALSEFERRNPGLTLHIAATHQYADFDASDVDVAIRYGGRRTAGLRREPLVEVSGLPVCAPRLNGPPLREPADLARHTLIHISQQPGAWHAWLKSVGVAGLAPRGELWMDTVPAALEAAEHGLGVALAMHPLIKGRKGFGKTLIAPLGVRSARTETLYLVTRPEHAQDRRIMAFRRWLRHAVRAAVGG